MIVWGSNSVIYNILTRVINYPLRRHCLGCHCDVISVKKNHEILRYLFQILATHLCAVANVFFNNKRKLSNDSAVTDGVKAFKKGQREK